ncbi:hypothetical protein QLH51_09435 [Sphingomonas sp. 2R-10]|uniref:hypothetical protein n=1 Tax=Sphingomonas sp. 2R-10 TaxID=3045148 RepID=UPI000F789B67|nr:hypothetical protein [Sphingomonas sp. 2R-10]MDJ0277016.1 hypothetical protein [Sphingomonas sp. 2R-10]
MMFAAVLLTAALAGGQPDRDGMRPVKTAEANRTMQMFADCVVARSSDRAKVDTLLRQPSDGPGLNAAGMALVRGECMPRALAKTEMRMPPTLMRAALFDARYRREFGKRSVDLGNVAPLVVASEFDGAPSPVDTYSRRLGDCVARREPAGARAFILSRANSDAENAAVNTLRPALAECVSKDNTLRLSRPMVRGIVGEALYKLSLAASANAGGNAGTKN